MFNLSFSFTKPRISFLDSIFGVIKNVIYDCTADEQVLNITEIDLFETEMFLFLIYEKLPEISDAKIGRKKNITNLLLLNVESFV